MSKKYSTHTHHFPFFHKKTISKSNHDGEEDWKTIANEAITTALAQITGYQLEEARENLSIAREAVSHLPKDSIDYQQFIAFIAELDASVSEAQARLDAMQALIVRAAEAAVKNQKTHYKSGVKQAIVDIILPHLIQRWVSIDKEDHDSLQAALAESIASNLEVLTTCCCFDGGRRLEKGHSLSQESKAVIESHAHTLDNTQAVNSL